MKTTEKEKVKSPRLPAEYSTPREGIKAAIHLRGKTAGHSGRWGDKDRNIGLIAGLGNPGNEYENTYHNIGILALEYLSKKNLSAARKMKPIRGLFEYTKTNGVAWIKPLVFMNESGKAVAEAGRFFKIKPEEMIIIHDDSDLHIGDFKISFGLGSAGHKGIESIIKQLGTKNFFRVRIGIRPPGENQKRRRKASELVLGNIAPENQKQLVLVFENISDILDPAQKYH